MSYHHLRRNDDTNLVYLVESSTNLLSAVWTKVGYTVTGTNVIDGVCDEIFYRILVNAAETYIRLEIYYP